MRRVCSLLAVVGILLTCLQLSVAVDKSKFKECAHASFCRRNLREFVPQDYTIVPSSVYYDSASGSINFQLLNQRHPLQKTLNGVFRLLQNDVVRFSVREVNPKYRRWYSFDSLDNCIFLSYFSFSLSFCLSQHYHMNEIADSWSDCVLRTSH